MKIGRIRKTEDFQNVFKNGKKAQGEIFCLYARKSDGLGPAAVGVTAAKKFAPRASKRNYVRRLVLALFREKGASLKKDALFVVRLTKNIGEIKKKPLSKAIKKDLEDILKKSGAVR